LTSVPRQRVDVSLGVLLTTLRASKASHDDIPSILRRLAMSEIVGPKPSHVSANSAGDTQLTPMEVR